MFDLAKKHGFILHRSKKHLVFKNKEGKTLVISGSPTDHRAMRNIEAIIRRLLAS